MSNIPAKAAARIAEGIKRFQPVLAAARQRDVNESDTVTIIKDLLAEVLGYDKYTEITAEYAIKSTFCDLAVRLEGVIRLLIEAKAIGLELKESHTKQAIDYAANQGIDWVVLTNGECWKIYKVLFAKPIGQELILEFCFSALNPRSQADLDTLFMIGRESWAKSLLGEYHTQRQALSRFFIGNLLLTDGIVESLRKELRRMSPGVKIEAEEIRAVLAGEVIKRDALEGEKAEEAKKKIVAFNRKLEREKAKNGAQVAMASAENLAAAAE